MKILLPRQARTGESRILSKWEICPQTHGRKFKRALDKYQTQFSCFTNLREIRSISTRVREFRWCDVCAPAFNLFRGWLESTPGDYTKPVAGQGLSSAAYSIIWSCVVLRGLLKLFSVSTWTTFFISLPLGITRKKQKCVCSAAAQRAPCMQRAVLCRNIKREILLLF